MPVSALRNLPNQEVDVVSLYMPNVRPLPPRFAGATLPDKRP
jgi:hypothetical protein